jgi:hypothetical protein
VCVWVFEVFSMLPCQVIQNHIWFLAIHA